MQKPIYLDYAATTPVDPRVADVMMKSLTMDGNFANPASRSHRYGWMAEEAVETARQQVAELIGADAREIVWTSGATESDNLAIKGVAFALQNNGKHLVTSAIEHKAVLDSFSYLESKGFEVTYLNPDIGGRVSVEQVRTALREDTILVSLMHTNNELGCINPISEIGALCRQKSVLFHCDAAQAVGKVPVDVNELNVDLLSISAHKFYGPKGVGCLYVRRKPESYIEPLIHGGGHERGMRSGTLPTHQIAGMGTAAELVKAEINDEMSRIESLRDKLWAGLSDIGGIRLNGDADHRAPGILNVSVDGVEGETLLMAMHEIAVSSGSACNSATVAPSFVLKGIGVPDDLALASVRFSVGRFTEPEEIDFAIEHVATAVSRLRS